MGGQFNIACPFALRFLDIENHGSLWEKQTTRCRQERRRSNESLTSFQIAPLRAALLGSRTASFGQMAAAFEINLNSMGPTQIRH
jgi:hypothetical protein